MMLAFRLIAWFSIVAITVAAWPRPRALPLGQIDTSGLIVRRDIRDSGRDESASGMKLDIYRHESAPQAPGARRSLRPSVLVVHSGSWIGGSKTDYRFDPRDTPVRLARGGMVVVVPDYSRARPDAESFPDVITEIRATVRWIRTHAAELDVDRDRIVILGQSAGAHLAACVAVPNPEADARAQESSRVQAVIAFYGAYDLATLLTERHLSHDPVRTLLGGHPGPSAATLQDASPLNRVTSQYPPTLLIHGTDDAWIPPAQSTRMAAALTSAKVTNKLILVAGARHGFEASVNLPTPRDLLPEIFAFLESVWNTRSGSLQDLNQPTPHQ